MSDILGGRDLGPGYEVPDEWQDFMLLREMHWPWSALSCEPVVPHYVTECFKVFLSMMRR